MVDLDALAKIVAFWRTSDESNAAAAWTLTKPANPEDVMIDQDVLIPWEQIDDLINSLRAELEAHAETKAKLAARILGGRGGKANTPAQQAARKASKGRPKGSKNKPKLTPYAPAES